MATSGFAFSLRYVLIKRARAVFMANVGYLIPVFAVLVVGIFLGENIGPEELFLAIVLIITLEVLFQRFAPLSRRRQT